MEALLFLFLLLSSLTLDWIGLKNRLMGTHTLQTLPIELTFKIFQYLCLQDLVRISLVCKHFKSITDIDVLWKKFYVQTKANIESESSSDSKKYHL
jgi:hypothetical protein